MNILSIDTSSATASVAIATEARIIAESVFSCERTLSARLLPEVERLLAVAELSLHDIDLFACAIGPGSFTGVRAGVATIQGFATATGKPCAGFSTLTLLAMNFPLASYPVCALLDARKSEVYGALYDNGAHLPTPLINETVVPPEEFLAMIRDRTATPVIFAGDGAVRYGELITQQLGELALFPPFPTRINHAANGVLLALESSRRGATVTPDRLLPVYLRKSEAEYAKIAQQKSHPPNQLNKNQRQ